MCFFWTLLWSYIVWGLRPFGSINKNWKFFLVVFLGGPFSWIVKIIDLLDIEPLETRARKLYNKAKFW